MTERDNPKPTLGREEPNRFVETWVVKFFRNGRGAGVHGRGLSEEKARELCESINSANNDLVARACKVVLELPHLRVKECCVAAVEPDEDGPADGE